MKTLAKLKPIISQDAKNAKKTVKLIKPNGAKKSLSLIMLENKFPTKSCKFYQLLERNKSPKIKRVHFLTVLLYPCINNLKNGNFR